MIGNYARRYATQKTMQGYRSDHQINLIGIEIEYFQVYSDFFDSIADDPFFRRQI